MIKLNTLYDEISHGNDIYFISKLTSFNQSVINET